MSQQTLDFIVNFLERRSEVIGKTEQLALEYQEDANINLHFNHTLLPPGTYILDIAVRCLGTGTFHSDTFVYTSFDNIIKRVEAAVQTFVVLFRHRIFPSRRYT